MCRGNINYRDQEEKVVSAHVTTHGSVCCELCDSDASIYCQADDAYLCRKCDKNVHGANFLAKRHIRCLLCSTCQNLTNRYLVGASVEVVLPSIVSKKETSSDNEGNSPHELKRPFLFL